MKKYAPEPYWRRRGPGTQDEAIVKVFSIAKLYVWHQVERINSRLAVFDPLQAEAGIGE
jgi:hypothetical protein